LTFKVLFSWWNLWEYKKECITSMKMLLTIRWTNPKDPERNKKRYEYQDKVFLPYVQKFEEKGVKWKTSGWADGSGQMGSLYEFETWEDFSKVYQDQEFQTILSRWSYLVDHCKIKIWRPSRQIHKK
jgi:hypothetical protein